MSVRSVVVFAFDQPVEALRLAKEIQIGPPATVVFAAAKGAVRHPPAGFGPELFAVLTNSGFDLAATIGGDLARHRKAGFGGLIRKDLDGPIRGGRAPFRGRRGYG